MTAALIAPASMIAQVTPPAQQESMRVDEFMTPEEASATGIANMTPEQRAAFERWLDRYTTVVTRVAKREPAASRQAHHGMGQQVSYPRHRSHVAELINGGDFVRLEDGTLWEIYSPDRVATANWKPNSTITLRERSVFIHVGNVQYDVLLTNGEAGTSASARFRGTGRPDELPEQAGSQ
jgi:hypothetical protein